MQFRALRPRLLLCPALLASAIVMAACAEVENPTTPSGTVVPTLTITSEGIARDVPFLVPGLPVRIVNSDSRPHRMHLDAGAGQSGCDAIDVSGELAPGESRVTAPLGSDAVACSIHDHMSHGDSRFAVRLVVDDGE